MKSLSATISGFPEPSYKYYHRPEYAAVRASVGCPFNCSYCAQQVLTGSHIQRKSPQIAAEELVGLVAFGINNLAFYDDALLFEAEKFIFPLLHNIIERKLAVNFHTPTGLNSRYVSLAVAGLLKKSDFVAPRISLETAGPARQKVTGSKVANTEFQAPAEHLRQAGYKAGEYVAYVMLGMSVQELSEVENTIRHANRCGAKVSVSEYSSIQGTADWDKVKNTLPSIDSLWYNNSAYPLLGGQGRKKIESVKQLAKDLNCCFT